MKITSMLNTFLINSAKTVSTLSRLLNLGNGSTWPGHLALQVQPTLIEDLLKKSPTKIILIVGTNGKTTTSRMLTTILRENGRKVIQNTSGANLVNGIASTLLLNTNAFGQLTADYAVFEVDENNLPLLLHHVTPTAILALNLFRDQLDRYGELDTIAKKWHTAFKQLPSSTHLTLNADDPLVAYLAKDVTADVSYFGLDHTEKEQKSLEHAADSIYCPQCNSKLHYKKIFYSHLGVWECPNCHVKRPLPQITESYYPLSGTYNQYNTLAAALTATVLGVSSKTIDAALHKVTPAFGRQETLNIKGKKVQLFLAKNPTSFNESLRTIADLKAKTVLLVLNDRIPDGRDISWIWDIDVEHFVDVFENIIISGDRTFDMSLRIQYSQTDKPFEKVVPEQNLQNAITKALEQTRENETLYILPTYSAMLEVRKILTGRKIL